MLFAGDRFSTAATVDLAEVDRRLATVEELTGIESEVHAMRVIATVDAQGKLAGVPFNRRLAQTLQFRLTDLQLQFDPGESELNSTTTPSVSRPVEVPRKLSIPLLKFGIAYGAFPRLAIVGIGVSATGLLLMAIATFTTWRAGEAAHLRVRYGHMMLDVDDEEAEIPIRRITVGRFDDLVRIAEREGLLILHHDTEAADEYIVVEHDVAYGYSIWKPAERPPADYPSFLDATPVDRAA
jgi:hypothetical protein